MGLLASTPLMAKEVIYDLVVDLGPVNVNGETVQAITINGQMPGPELHFTEGDMAVMRLTNRMDIPVTIRWHGLLVPNHVDGVPYVTNVPIAPGKTVTYRFPLIQSGTYWYHSHFGLQEQYGLKGAIVIDPKNQTPDQPRDVVLSIGDWNNVVPEQTMRDLRRNSPVFAVKNGQVESIAGAIESDTLGNVIKRSFYKILDSDLSDVAYDAFITNGQKESFVDAQPGELLRLRVINSSTSSYFYLNYAGGDMEIIAADGLNITPYKINMVLLSTAETYDVLVRAPSNGRLEFPSTSFDGTGHTSTWIGIKDSSQPVAAADIAAPDVYQLSVKMTNAMLAMKAMKKSKVPSSDHASVAMPSGGGNSVDGNNSMGDSSMTKQPMAMKRTTFTGGDKTLRPPPPYSELRALQPRT